jgi:hypothetical protein
MADANAPRISVVLTTHNYGKFVTGAICPDMTRCRQIRFVSYRAGVAPFTIRMNW